MTYREIYQQGFDTLVDAGVPDAKLDARLLLEYVCGTTQHDMILNGNRVLNEQEQARYEELIAKRASRIPLQHLTGVQEFMGYTFKVNKHVLVPRQDTEILVEEALQFLKPEMTVLDMCTGSGCILLSLLALGQDVTGTGVDISAKALQVATENVKQISAQADKDLSATFLESDLFEKVTGKFDMIVSNPPYIASAVIDTLEPEVRLHEPLNALDGTADGLYFYERIVAESRDYLKENGLLIFEIGHDQGEAVSDFMKKAGFQGVYVKKDYAGLDRVVVGFFSED